MFKFWGDINSQSPESQPWTHHCHFLGFSALYFKMAEIHPELQKTLKEHHCISDDGKKVRLFIKLLGETCGIVRELTAGKWIWREVLAHSMLYMFAKVFDFWLKDEPNCKWNSEGGSRAFFQNFLPRYLETGAHSSECRAAPSSEEVSH